MPPLSRCYELAFLNSGIVVNRYEGASALCCFFGGCRFGRLSYFICLEFGVSVMLSLCVGVAWRVSFDCTVMVIT